MKIGILIDNLHAGVLQRQALDWASGLQQLGHEVTVLGLRAGMFVGEVACQRKIPYMALQGLDIGVDRWGLAALNRWIQAHMPQKMLLCGENVSLYATELQKAFSSVQVAVLLNSTNISPKIVRALRGVAAVVCSDTQQVAFLKDKGELGAQISLIDAPVFDAPIEEKRCEKLRAYYRATESTCVIAAPLNSDRSTLKAGIVKLFKNFKKYPSLNWQLWLVGGGRGFVTAEWLVHCYGIHDRVKFVGEGVEIMEFFKSANIALYLKSAKTDEFFANQACMAALPVLSEDTAAFYAKRVPEASGKALNILGANHLESVLKECIMSPQKYEILGRVGHEWAGAHFDCATQAAHLLDFCAAKR